MWGLWGFLITTVVVASAASVIRAYLKRYHYAALERQMAALAERVAKVEARLDEQRALPPPERARIDDLDRRVGALETIVTGADELLERRIREAAQHLLAEEAVRDHGDHSR